MVAVSASNAEGKGAGMAGLAKKDMNAIVAEVTKAVVAELQGRPRRGGSGDAWKVGYDTSGQVAESLHELVGVDAAWKITYDTSSEAIEQLRGLGRIEHDAAWKITYDTSGDVVDHISALAEIGEAAWKITYDTSDAGALDRVRVAEELGEAAWKITYDTSSDIAGGRFGR